MARNPTQENYCCPFKSCHRCLRRSARWVHNKCRLQTCRQCRRLNLITNVITGHHYRELNVNSITRALSRPTGASAIQINQSTNLQVCSLQLLHTDSTSTHLMTFSHSSCCFMITGAVSLGRSVSCSN